MRVQEAIQSFPFNSDFDIQGILVETVAELVAKKGKELLTRPHRVEFYALLLVEEGSGFHYVDRKMYPCRPGTLFVLSPHQVHHFDSNFQWEGHIITFKEFGVFPKEDLNGVYNVMKAMRGVDVITDSIGMVGQDFQQLYKEQKTTYDGVSERIQSNLLQNIMLKIFTRGQGSYFNSGKNKDIDDYQKFSDAVEKYFNTRHNASEYVTELGTTIKRLNNLCKKMKGISAKQFIDSRIVLEAKRLIGYTPMSISEIAVVLGFHEPSNLAKFFKRHTGITPTEYRSMSKAFSNKKHL
ncbi:helix-turn-helix transcriptional regulator [Vibrio sp. HN007]|uniref:AraC family transcriptional regulator n=1 Tax=Vibrio iocasae TaxID=3098914 RepID=UPI0035D47671